MQADCQTRVNSQRLELKGSVSYIQLAKTLGCCTSNLTLHSDGTTQFGTKYGSYQVSTDDLSYRITSNLMDVSNYSDTFFIFDL